MIRIIPSVASADPLRLADEVGRVSDVPYLHFDIEDGVFVPNITFGTKTIRALAPLTAHAEKDAHLLTIAPLDYLSDLRACGISKIAAHIEALPYPGDFLVRVRQSGAAAGLALNFKTPAAALTPFTEFLDYVIIMTAEPDGGAQIFRRAMLEKIREARALLPPRVSVQADGGIGAATLAEVAASGADTVIMGRAIWQSKDPAATHGKFENSV